jgi:hypothetical protein
MLLKSNGCMNSGVKMEEIYVSQEIANIQRQWLIRFSKFFYHSKPLLLWVIFFR